MKRRTALIALVSSLAVLLTVLLTGCGSAAPSDNSVPTQKGYLTLSVNPQIRIEYNADGLVTGVEGRNDDGRVIAESYTDYIGKDCGTVLRELVTDIYQAGYFIEDADSGKRQVVLQVEPGSALPDDDFLELLRGDVQAAVRDLALSADVTDIGSNDYDTRYEKDGTPSPYITLDKARQIALSHAGIAAADVTWTDREFDFERGRPVYELEFFSNGREYDYEIDAADGRVLKYSSEREDDRPAATTPSTTPSTAPSTPAQSSKSEYIGLDKARSVALQRAGVSSADVRWEESDFDLDDGVPVYELEFRAKGYEYSCDVHAVTGAVLDYDVERDD